MTAPAVHVFEHRLLSYQRTFRGSLFSSFLQPALFLTAMGVGLGALVNQSGGAAAALGGVPYLVFLAPGLLAGTAMQTAAFESTFPVMASIRWVRSYHAMLATPISVTDIVVGQLGWIAVRLTMVAAIFVTIMTLFGAVRSPAILLAIPAAVLTGMAFSAPIAAFSATQENAEGFNMLFRFVINPLFLFSGTFFPVEQLPAILHPIAYATPLYHGVALARQLSLGTGGVPEMIVHATVLFAYFAVGAWACLVTFRGRLVK
jgi:lipooligosaccharide transport system permease protein